MQDYGALLKFGDIKGEIGLPVILLNALFTLPNQRLLLLAPQFTKLLLPLV